MLFNKIIGHCSFLPMTGYAAHSRDFFTRLNNHIPVRIRNFAWTETLDHLSEIHNQMVMYQTWKEAPFEFGQPYFKHPLDKILNIILLETDHYYYYQEYDEPTIGYNVWEITRQPENFFKQWVKYLQLWVPTEWQRQCTIEQGCPEDRVKVVHEGVDGSVFFPGEPELKLKEYNDGRFKFMIFGRWDYRKATTETIRAFLNTFNKSEPVDLIISVDNPFPADGMKSTEERLRKYRFQDNRIKVLHFPSREEYVSHLKSGHCLISCARAEGWGLPLCVPGGELIHTCDNLIPIEDIKKDDLVITHLGRERKVLNTMSRYVKEQISNIYIWGDFEPIRVTKEHPLFVIKRNKFKTLQGSFERMVEMEPEWIQAKDVEKGDIVLRAIAPQKEYKTLFDLKDFDSKLNYDNEKVWYNTGYNQFGELKTYTRFVNLKDIVLTLGWYIAEGSGSKANIEFSMSSDEEHIVETLLEEIYTVFGANGNYKENDHNCLRLRFPSTILSKFFTTICGKGAHNKHIPNEILYGDLENLRILLGAYFQGDGHINCTGTSRLYSVSTVSYLLARQCIIGLERLGLKASIQKSTKVGYVVSWCEDNHNFRHANKSWWHKNYGRAMLVKKIEIENYDGLVYNFEVEEDNSYQLVLASVHNCESIACGTPTICSNYGAQLEFAEGVSHMVNIKDHLPPKEVFMQRDKQLEGTYCEPDFEHLGQVMRDVYENYKEYKVKALADSEIIRDKFSWENAVDTALNLINNITEEEIKDYKKRIYKSPEETVTYTFHNGAMADVKGPKNLLYNVKFIDMDTDKIIHEQEIETYHWVKANRNWYTNWKIRIETNNELYHEHIMDLTGKRVIVVLDAKGMGDRICWVPYVEEFRKKHNCTIFLSTGFNWLFEKAYPEINFIDYNVTLDNIYAIYNVRIEEKEINIDNNINKTNWHLIPLQQAASDYLGLEYREIRPDIQVEKSRRPIKDRYVCIGEHSTFRCKYWNNPKGWQTLVDYLNSVGYRVMVITKERSLLKNIIHRTGRPLEETVNNLQHCEFYIGVSSGLAWLAWALKVPVTVISGCTMPFVEMQDCIRIFNPDVCNGCFNDPEIDLEKPHWDFCPRFKNYECSTSISPETVIKKIQPLITVQEPIKHIQIIKAKK